MWLGPAIAMVAMVESLAAVGIVVPGVAILFALGAMAGTGLLDIYSTLLWAFAGAVVGDGVSFWLGYHYHEKLKSWWPFNRHPQWLKHGEQFFYKYGMFSVVIGRFVGMVRPFIPVVAGMMDMPPMRFFVVNVLSALAWAPVYLLPGFLAGAALTMKDQFPDQLWLLATIVGSISILLPGILLLIARYLRGGHILIAASILALFGSLCFLEYYRLLIPINQLVTEWLAVVRTPWLNHFMSGMTWLGSMQVLVPLWLVSLVWLKYQKNWAGIKQMLWIIPAFASVWVGKLFFESPRPVRLENLEPYSFPSGHTAMAVFYFCSLAIIVGRSMCIKRQWGLLSAAMLVALLVGTSRLILNVHWLSDVLAGFSLGLFWLFAAMRSHRILMP